MFFLSSIPRSGGTLLTRLLAQRGDINTGGLSSLVDILGAMKARHKQSPTKEGNIYCMMHEAINGFYGGKTDLILNKSWTWGDPIVIDALYKIFRKPPKIIATVRPMRECLASFIRITQENPFEFVLHSTLAKTLFGAFDGIRRGYEAYPEVFCLIEYEEIINDAQKVCDKCADFLELPRFYHDLNAIPELNEDSTLIWGIPELHKIRQSVSRFDYSAEKILTPGLWKYYDGGNFWRKDKGGFDYFGDWIQALQDKDYDKYKSLVESADKNDVRATFNSAHYYLRDNLSRGVECLEEGYKIRVFGTPSTSDKPRWRGEHGKVLLLHLEGGFGDQIWGLRWVRELKRYNPAKIIVASSPELWCLLHRVDGIDAYVDVDHENCIHHDYYVPSMRCINDFGFNYEDINGSPYIHADRKASNSIGIRWAGNSEFGDNKYRLFNPLALFDLAKKYKVVSLQKGVKVPTEIESPRLDTWEDTAQVIEGLSLVISSCTSVAHLAAAMGVPTRIIVPVVPYYLWSPPGEKTCWYESATLCRQEKIGEWDLPMRNATNIP